MDDIELFLSNEICPILRGEVTTTDSKWFNGRIFQQRKKYKVKNLKSQLSCDFFANENEKSNTFLSNNDVHSFKLKYQFPSTYSSAFKINQMSFWWKLMKRKKFLIDSTDKNLIQFFEENELYRIVFTEYFDPEFSPIIKGKNKNGVYQINIKFCLARMNEEVFNLLCNCIQDFEEKISSKIYQTS